MKVANSHIQILKWIFRVLIAENVANKSDSRREFIFPESGEPNALKIESFHLTLISRTVRVSM